MKLTIDEINLQPGAVNNLVVDSHLETIVSNDKDADGATAVVEGLGETGKETALVKDGKALLDITTLGHGDNATVLTDVKDAVLLEDRAEHVLDNNRRGGVGDEAGLLMELLGEQVNTKVTVLASLGGGGDANDLASASLEDQEITDADVVARDSDSVEGSHLASWGTGGCGSCGEGRGGGSLADGCGCGSCGGSVKTNDLVNRGCGVDGRVNGRVGRTGRGSRRSTSVLLLYNDFLVRVVELGSGEGVLRVAVVVAVRVDGVGDALGDLVGNLVETLTERVVLSFVVVISHITLEVLGGGGSGTSSRFYSDL